MFQVTGCNVLAVSRSTLTPGRSWPIIGWRHRTSRRHNTSHVGFDSFPHLANILPQPTRPPIMSGPAAADTHISTSHSYFLRPAPNPSHPPISLLLRGVNISSTSKYPNLSNRPPITGDDATASRTQRNDARRLRAGVQSQLSEEDGGMWRNAEAGGSEGWFVGHPFTEDKVDVSCFCLLDGGLSLETVRYI